MFDSAIALVGKGKPVFPCGKDKKPLVAWADFQKRIPTVDEVREWWTKWPEANIGMPTGKLSGISVVDIDPKNGGTVPEGMPTMTTVVKTGSGGWHYYYKHADGVRNTDERGTGFKGVDIRGDGGFVIVPPSITNIGSYEVIVEEPLIPFPTEFFKIKKERFDVAAIIGGVSEGSRNMTAAQFAGSVIAKYRKEEWESIVWPILQAWNKTCTPPEPEKDLRKTFESICKTHLRNHAEEEKKQGHGVPIDDLDLVKSAEGKTIKCVENAARLLERHPDFKGRLRFDEFAQDPQIRENGEWRRIQDDDYTNIQRAAQSMYQHFATYGLELFVQSIMSVCSKNKVDSAKDWISTLAWDGEQRIEEFCMKAYGVEDTVYHRAVGKNFLLGMAARILIPGCHHRSVLILEGPQNSKKSKSFRTLVGEKWFLEDAPLNVENVSFHMSLWGKLIVEFSEGVIFSKIDMGKLKGLVSTPSDTIVKKWGKTPIDMRRRCVFVITTNQNQYFSDTTGNTRFFPVVIKNIDLEFIEKHRDQLFAEAAARIRMGEQWWDDDEEITKMNTEEQESRISVSILEEIVDEWLSSKRSQPAIEEGFQTKIFFETMTKDGEKRLRHFSPGEAREVAAILRKKGFFQKVYRIDGYCLRLWKKV